MCELGAEATPACALATRGRAVIMGHLCAPAGASLAGRLVPCGPRQPVRLNLVARPRQAKHGLWVWAARSGFSPFTVVIEIIFIFILNLF
jgi:hypothetical protein